MEKFRAKRIRRTSTLTIPAPPDRVFPLLCPVREYEWLPGWSCDLIYTDSGVAEKGCIFRTSFLGEGEETWVASRHEPERHQVEFVRFIGGARLVQVEVSLCAGERESTNAVWTQTITALDEEGNAYIDAFSEETHLARMRLLERALSHFCQTGKMIGASQIRR